MKEPVRLLDSSGNGSFERSLLRSALDASPPPGARDAVLRALESSLGAAAVTGASAHGIAQSLPAAAAPSATAKVAAVKLGLVKIVGLATVSVALIGGAAYAGFRQHDARTRETISASLPDVAQSPDVAQDEGAGASTPVERPVDHEPTEGRRTHDASSPTPVVAKEPAVRTNEAPVQASRASSVVASRPGPAPDATPASTYAPAAPSASTAASAPSTSNLADESEAFAEARSRLRGGDAQGALRSLDAMQARYGAGGLSEERAALYIEALGAAGQSDLARRSADAFIAAHPGSALCDRLRAYASH